MHKSKIINKEKQRAADKVAYADSFIARNYWLWVLVAFVAYPISSILSAMTEGGHVFLRLSATGSPIIAWTGTVLIVILIESLKYILGKGAVDDLQAGVFSSDRSFVAAFFVKALGFIAVMGFSIFLSVSGAPDINEYLRKQMKPVEAEYVNLEDINSQFDNEALPFHNNIATYKKTTWKGKIVEDARKMIMKEQDQIAAIEARRSAALAAAMEENSRIRAEWEEQTAKNGNYMTGFAGLGEAICIFCLIFIGIYDDGLKKEADTPEASTPPQPGGPVNTAQHPDFNMLAALISQMQQGGYQQVANTPPPPPQQRRPIGFNRDPEMKAERVGLEDDLPDLDETAVEQLLNNCSTIDHNGVRVFDLKYTKQLVKQKYTRSKESKTEEARERNRKWYLGYRKVLEHFGFSFEEDGNELIVHEPRA